MAGTPTHIKNPLTIVGIFASLVEVMGLGVLPLLTPEIQIFYIWFVMGFPTLLVGAFFGILCWRPHVFYAPSDFTDDKNYMEVNKRLQPASATAILRKREDEIEASTGSVEPPKGAVEPTPPEKSESPNEVTADSQRSKGTLTTAYDRDIAQLAEEWAMSNLAEERGIKFDRNVQLDGSNLVYDGVAVNGQHVVIAEVRYTRGGIMKQTNIDKIFEGPQRFCSTLPDSYSRRLEFILLFVADPPNDEQRTRIERSRQRIQVRSERYPFKTTVRVVELALLRQKYSLGRDKQFEPIENGK